MGGEYDILEAIGAILTGVALVILLTAGGAGLILGPVLLVMGLVVWKMGEMRREFNEKLDFLRREIESLKASGGTADG
ncbi:hypothetical protein [Thermococcus thioreducens]|uniref:Uncharacterized protein n=1 Tax=Thermococcus thioreducens TaxID=277988 RepID=A0A0Q2MR65_9EURY|nr:hypothetical protein [Thermococcus thioreducens]ASJ12930.1 hypothetical protein A3L14_08545 [Thermococcus thioreducens]KQH82199.1 hypothetical protein AMR53_07100 [Thermococcus thioreducens]SEV83297.1 hypothetical protein SAMN05216170_0235 [Thermococcus thioreducens]